MSAASEPAMCERCADACSVISVQEAARLQRFHVDVLCAECQADELVANEEWSR